MRMRHIIIVVCSALQCSPTLSHERYSFWKKIIEHKMCYLIYSTTYVWHTSQYKTNWATYDNTGTYVSIESAHYPRLI
jgi:hypothetical protein